MRALDLALLGGAFLVAVGLFGVAVPRLFARLYGVAVAVDDTAPLVWVRAAALRDVALGVVLAGAAHADARRVAALAVAAAIGLALVDLAMAFVAGGRRVRLAHANHVAGIVGFGVLLALLLL